jgi:hypothetical protein
VNEPVNNFKGLQGTSWFGKLNEDELELWFNSDTERIPKFIVGVMII